MTFVLAALLFSCPNMNGHYVHKQFLVNIDLNVTQVACDSMSVKMHAHVAGEDYDENVDTPLDGVSRPKPSDNPNEKDFVSGRFEGDTVVLKIDRFVTQSNGGVNHTTDVVDGTLTSPNTLNVVMSTLDSNGQTIDQKNFDFEKVQPQNPSELNFTNGDSDENSTRLNPFVRRRAGLSCSVGGKLS